MRTACAASSKPSAWPCPPVRARERPTATATRPFRGARPSRAASCDSSRTRSSAIASRPRTAQADPGTHRAPAVRTRASAASGSPAAGSASNTTATCCSASSMPRRRARATSTASGSSPSTSASRKSRSALRPATWSISRPFRITCAAVAAIAPSTSSSAGVAAWRPALSRTPTSSPPAWIGAATPVVASATPASSSPWPRLGQHPHPAGERIEQRGVGHPLDAPPGAGDGADAEAAAGVAGREQHRVGAEQRAGRVRQPVQRAAAGCRRAQVVDRRGEGADGVELAPALGVQLRRLDRGGHQRGDRRHQRQVVLGELVRRLGVQGDHSDEPVGRRDQRVGERRLEPLVVQFGDQQVARIVAGVVAHDGGRPVERRPAREAGADLQRVDADPLLVALRACPHTQSLGVRIEQVDERPAEPVNCANRRTASPRISSTSSDEVMRRTSDSTASVSARRSASRLRSAVEAETGACTLHSIDERLERIDRHAHLGAFWRIEVQPPTSEGPLTGRVVAFEDCFSVAGMDRDSGAPFLRERCTVDATTVRRHRAAGATIVGKLSMHQLAWGMMGQTPGRPARAQPARRVADPGRLLVRARRPRSPPGSSTWRPAPTPAARCGCRRRPAASSA